jgi:hypothetical protein
MGILNNLFRDTEALAQDIVTDTDSILRIWSDYRDAFSKEAPLIEQIVKGQDTSSALSGLKALQVIELAEITDEESDESRILSDLEGIEHSRELGKIERIHLCFNYWHNQDMYIYKLLEHLLSILKRKLQIIRLLRASPAGNLPAQLKSQHDIQEEINGRLTRAPDFEDAFVAIVREEKRFKRLTKEERKLASTMRKSMEKILSQVLTQGPLVQWASSLDNRMHEEWYHHLEETHEFSDIEFVHMPIFEQLARETMPQNLRFRPGSEEQVLNVFIELFRQLYTDERVG